MKLKIDNALESRFEFFILMILTIFSAVESSFCFKTTILHEIRVLTIQRFTNSMQSQSLKDFFHIFYFAPYTTTVT